VKINLISDTDIDKLLFVLRRNTSDRFKYDVEVVSSKRGTKYTARIEIRNVRLVDSKLYCGNHPNECEIGGQKPRKGNFLEGTDWVDWNDRLNDALDELNAEANVRSAACIMRKGAKRRVNYGSHMQGRFWQWDLDTNDNGYEDWRGEIAPPSNFPIGTPGEYLRKV
jgi:hypothetical protein